MLYGPNIDSTISFSYANTKIVSFGPVWPIGKKEKNSIVSNCKKKKCKVLYPHLWFEDVHFIRKYNIQYLYIIVSKR